MFRNAALTKGLTRRVGDAANKAMRNWSSRLVEQEPQITERLLAYIENSLDDKSIGGVYWTAKSFTDRGRRSQESEIGADFLGSFSLTTPSFSTKKGFLAQAKVAEPADSFRKTEFERMQEQCERMLRVSPASFVFLYSQQSRVQVVPALSIIGARPANPHELTAKPITNFFSDHFECFVGEDRLGVDLSTDIEAMVREFRANAGIAIVGGVEE